MRINSCLHTGRNGFFPHGLNLFQKRVCQFLEDVLSDLYKQVTAIREAIDLKELGDQCKSCIDYGVNNCYELIC